MKWTDKDFVDINVPKSTREFLIDYGLPETVPFTTLEFGPAVQEHGDLIIGADFESPVIVNTVGIVSVLYDSGEWFFNSSVGLLALCIDEYLKMKNCDEDFVANAIEGFRSFLHSNDPKCLSETRSVWRTMLDDYQAMSL